MIVLISGRKHSGKDSSANLLIKELGFVRLAFADKLKELAAEFLNLPLSTVMTEAFKDTLMGKDAFGGTLVGRDVLQRLGSAARRTFGENFWVEQVVKQIDSACSHRFEPRLNDIRCGYCRKIKEAHRNMVVSDARHWNEILDFKKIGAVVIRVNRIDCEQKHDFVAQYNNDCLALGMCQHCLQENDGNLIDCGLPERSHPSHYSGDMHESEMALPDSGSCYNAVFESGSGEEQAEKVLDFVKRRMK